MYLSDFKPDYQRLLSTPGAILRTRQPFVRNFEAILEDIPNIQAVARTRSAGKGLKTLAEESEQQPLALGKQKATLTTTVQVQGMPTTKLADAWRSTSSSTCPARKQK